MPDTPVASGGDTAPSALAAKARERLRARPLLVAVPFYKRPELVDRVLDGLDACRDELAQLGAEVVFYDDSPAEPSLGLALERARARPGGTPFRIVANRRNLGFVATANLAIAEASARGMDLVLLNSDTVATPGAFKEMAEVALADPMIGFVNPRSNNATLATLPDPMRFRDLPVGPAREAWGAIAPLLPRFSYTPTANGFCLLIRWLVMAEFGGFDEIYGRGYNEENDLVMRAGRRGYRSVLANHAFVWHEGHASFGEEQKTLEVTNRRILLRRYPEYPRLTSAYYASPEQRAEVLLSALVPDGRGRLAVALDFSGFLPAHNGTFVAGLQLLAQAQAAWSDRYDISVICSEAAYAFHGMARFGAGRREVHDRDIYACIFRVGQPYDWGALERLADRAATFGVFMLDTISQDCTQLYEPEVGRLWTWTLQHADFVATTSLFTDQQLSRRHATGAEVKRVRSLHSLDLDDYRLPPPETAEEVTPPGYILVLGNHFLHKDVAVAANALALADPSRRVLVLGGPAKAEPPVDAGRHVPSGLLAADNIVRFKAGGLSDSRMSALYAGAQAVVIPSHYEGFGMPLLNALAAKRPVFVRPLPVVTEICEALGSGSNVHAFLTTEELVAMLETPPAWSAERPQRRLSGDARRAADDIGRFMDEAVTHASYDRIVSRLGSLAGVIAKPGPSSVPATPQAFVADHVAQRVRSTLERTLAQPAIFAALRRLVRFSRRLRPRPAGR